MLWILRFLILTLTPALILPAVFAAEPSPAKDVEHRFHVALNGKDSNAGSVEAPFATIGRALKAARALGSNWKGDVVILIRGGTYYLPETLVIQPEDSGKNGHRLVITHYGDERVKISGGVPVTGWEETAGGIWKTTRVPAVDFRHLTVNGRRMPRAGDPDGPNNFHTIAAWDPAGPEFAIGTDITDPAKIRGALGVWDADASFVPKLNDSELRQVEAFVERQTGSAILRIASVGSRNEGGKGITYFLPQSPERERLFTAASWQQPKLAYRFENAMVFLDKAGEWFLDKTARVLYYIPRKGENLKDPGAVTVVAPVLETLLRFQGTEDKPVRDIVIRGLQWGDTTWFHPNKEGFVSLYPGVDYRHNPTTEPLAWWNAYLHPAAVHLEGTERVTLEGNVLRALGGMGINLHEWTRLTRVDGNAVLETAGIGIAVYGRGFTSLPNDPLHHPHAGKSPSVDDQITNNRIQGFGRDYWVAAGIATSYAAGLRIEHNEVSDGGGMGIMIGWYGGWTSCHEKVPTNPNPPLPFPDCETATENVRIAGNRVFRVAHLQDDVGAIYTLGHQSNARDYKKGLQIRDNYVHDISRPNAWTTWGGLSPFAALYVDGDTAFATIANNIFEIPTGPGAQMVFLNPDDQTSVPPHDIAWSDEGAKVPVGKLDGDDNPAKVGDNVSKSSQKPAVKANAGLLPEYRQRVPSLD